MFGTDGPHSENGWQQDLSTIVHPRFSAACAGYHISVNSLTGPRNCHHLCRYLSRALHIFQHFPFNSNTRLIECGTPPPYRYTRPLPPVEQASSKPEDSKPGDEVEYGSEEFPISEDVIPHGVSVIMPDNFVKHLVVPHMSSGDVAWFTYLSEDLNIIAKPYFIDSDKSNTPPGTLTVPINKVNPAPPHLPIP